MNKEQRTSLYTLRSEILDVYAQSYMKKLLYKIKIAGSVQGVGFRWNAVREARSRGIAGYVKNLDDGSVYIEAEGYASQLDDFLVWCRMGPAFATVESVVFDVGEPSGYKDFGIERSMQSD